MLGPLRTLARVSLTREFLIDDCTRTLRRSGFVVRPFGRNAAARGGALVAVAVVIGFLLLWQGGVGGSPDAVIVADSSGSDDPSAATLPTRTPRATRAATDDGTGEDAVAPDDTVDTRPRRPFPRRSPARRAM